MKILIKEKEATSSVERAREILRERRGKKNKMSRHQGSRTEIKGTVIIHKGSGVVCQGAGEPPIPKRGKKQRNAARKLARGKRLSYKIKIK